MPVGNCRACDRFFILPLVGPLARHCPRCRRPLQKATPREALSRPSRSPAPVAVPPLRISAREEEPAGAAALELPPVADPSLV